MLRRSAIILGTCGAALLAGCADLMQQSANSGIAPEWFQAKAIEVKGEGYPELKDIPQTRTEGVPQAQWDSAAEALKKEAAEVETQLAAAGTIPTDEEVRARAAQWRAIVEAEEAKVSEAEKPKS